MSKKAKAKSDSNPEEIKKIEKKVLERYDTSSLEIFKTKIQERNEELNKELENAKKELQQIKLLNINAFVLQKMTEKMDDEFKSTIKNSDQLKMHYQEIIKNMDDEKQKEMIALTSKFNIEIKKKDEEIKELVEKFNDISGFPDREKGYQESILINDKKYKELEEIHFAEIKKIEKMFANQRDQNEYEYQQKIDEIMKNAHMLAEKEALDSDKLVEKQNKKILEQINLEKSELSQLKKDYDQINSENFGLKQQMMQQEKTIKDHLNVNYKQQLKIKRLEEKIEYLKRYVATEVIKYTKELELLKNNNAKEIYDYEYKIKSLKQQIKMKSKEIKTLKSLSQMILDQRSDLEEFFLDALDKVRNDIYSKRNADELPSLSKSLKSFENEEKLEKKDQHLRKIRIKDMDLQDRDRILRIIFSKMNSGSKVVNWRELLRKIPDY